MSECSMSKERRGAVVYRCVGASVGHGLVHSETQSQSRQGARIDVSCVFHSTYVPHKMHDTASGKRIDVQSKSITPQPIVVCGSVGPVSLQGMMMVDRFICQTAGPAGTCARMATRAANTRENITAHMHLSSTTFHAHHAPKMENHHPKVVNFKNRALDFTARLESTYVEITGSPRPTTPTPHHPVMSRLERARTTAGSRLGFLTRRRTSSARVNVHVRCPDGTSHALTLNVRIYLLHMQPTFYCGSNQRRVFALVVLYVGGFTMHCCRWQGHGERRTGVGVIRRESYVSGCVVVPLCDPLAACRYVHQTTLYCPHAHFAAQFLTRHVSLHVTSSCVYSAGAWAATSGKLHARP